MTITDILQPVYELQGNQFVFIPCTIDTYKKTDFGTTYQNTYWDNMTQTSEMEQISKYGGFYVGRYEAGLASAISPSATSQTHTTTNQVYNLDGIPESKPGKIPWTFIDWTKAQKNSRSMYNSNYVISGLISGTMWDTMINKISAADSTKSVTSTTWGNNKNQQVTYNGKIASATLSTNWSITPFGGYVKGGTKASSTGNNGWMLTTGASEQVKGYNLYDVSGNVWEWTEDSSYYGGNTNTQYRLARGGGFIDTHPTCYRAGTITNIYTGFHMGFRVALYMK
ncbi:Formylglycine-generating sulfatase enzyme [compost metagenome]